MVPAEAQLSDLLMQWEERKLHGQGTSLEELCAQMPELMDELQRRIRALEALDAVLDLTDGTAEATLHGELAAPRPSPLPEIPGYRVLAELPEGGMGRPLQVLNLALNRVEVLKTIKPRFALRPSVAERFRLEMQAMAKLKHPHIVGIYDAREHAGQAYFTMEFVEGGTLRKHLRRLSADPRAAVALLAKVARAVDFVHTKGILHRDLKPENILLNHDEPLVTDFGLAKLFDQDPELTAPGGPAVLDLTQDGAIAGTISYLSPQAAAGETAKLTAATDIWALGVILYELLTGVRPFKASDTESLLNAIKNAAPLPPRVHKADLDPQLEAICMQCLEKDTDQRFTSAAEFAARLERWLAPEPRRRLMRRHPIAAGAVAACTVGAIVYAAMVIASRRHADDAMVVSFEERKAALLAAVAKGERTTLIPELGPPNVYRWATRGVHDNASESAAAPFSVHADGFALLELLPAHALRHYRVRLEIHHDNGARDGEVGIYFGHSETTTPLGLPIHCYCAIAFNDILAQGNQPQPSNQMRLNPCLLFSKVAGEEPGIRRRGPPGLSSAPFMPAGRPSTPHWRVVQLDVSPDEICVEWDQFALAPLPRAQLNKSVQFLLANSPVPPAQEPQFLPQEALGLYVFGATGWFRSCTIEALREP
jgi:serine/threonine-protein kinase